MPARSSRPYLRALVVLLLASFLAVSAAACNPKPSLAEFERTVQGVSLTSFHRWWRQEQAAAHHVSQATIDRWLRTAPGRLDSAAARSRRWDVSTDRCSSSPDAGPVFDFRIPCIRHDVAWRNLRRLQRQLGGSIDTRARRSAANRQFLRDMDATCTSRPIAQRTPCHGVARAYFTAVSAVS